MSIWQDIKARYQQGNPITKLIMVNVAVYIALAIIYVPIYLFTPPEAGGINSATGYDQYWDFIYNWFYVPSDLTLLPFRFWTFFTYMFLHNPYNLLHIVFNMLFLYWFGIKLSDLISNDKVFPIYIWGGFAGALAFIIGFNILPAFSSHAGNLVGASASVMAIVLATATLNPKGEMHLLLLGRVQLQYIALGWVIINLVSTIYSNPGGALAHLGGAFMGWFFIFQLRRGVDLSIPINRAIGWVTGNKARPAKTTRRASKSSVFKPRMKVHKGSQRSDYYGKEYGRSFMQKYRDMSREECLNTILDKIKRSGYDSLTEDEKVFLDRYQ